MNLEPSKILDFVASVYPYVSQYISDNIDPYRKLDFDPQDICCFSCGSTRMVYMRRLPCGHFVDHNCLKERVLEKKFYCDKDGAKFLKGYENLLKAQEDGEGMEKRKDV